MIIVKLQGGLGNQMFQYATGKALAIKHDTDLKADLTFLLDRTIKGIVFRDFDLDIFPNIYLPVASLDEVKSFKQPYNTLINSLARKTIGIPSFYKEKTFAFNTDFHLLPANVYISGYWQSEKYFKGIEKELRSDFKFQEFKVPENFALKEKIRSANSICLNVRRGDFVNNAASASYLGFIGLEYYAEAIDFLDKKLDEPHYFIFSDDVEWCKANFDFKNPVTFVDHRYAGTKFADYLQLMSACRHFLIPNSSFAWWAAWLNSDKAKVVIAPSRWFNDTSIDSNDLVPGNWLKM